jgi:hypothetical protein
MAPSCSDLFRQPNRRSGFRQEERQKNAEGPSEQRRCERRLIEVIDCGDQPRDRSRPRPGPHAPLSIVWRASANDGVDSVA